MRRSCTATRPLSNGATLRRDPWGKRTLRSEIDSVLIEQLDQECRNERKTCVLVHLIHNSKRLIVLRKPRWTRRSWRSSLAPFSSFSSQKPKLRLVQLCDVDGRTNGAPDTRLTRISGFSNWTLETIKMANGALV